jgi:hypothetical protein
VVVDEHDLARAGDDQRRIRGGVQERPGESRPVRVQSSRSIRRDDRTSVRGAVEWTVRLTGFWANQGS